MTRFQLAVIALLSLAAAGVWLDRPAVAQGVASQECAAFTLPDLYWASQEGKGWLEGMKEKPFHGGTALPPGWIAVGGGARDSGVFVVACQG